MTDKTLKDVAIDIKGKKYVLVADRVCYFNETYPNGSIVTERISENGMEIVKATVTPDCDKPGRYFTGYSQAKWGEGFINKTSALENAETSATGRALAFMGIGVIDSIASSDEIVKANNAAKSDKPKSRFQTAISNTQYMKECLDEDDYINKVKNKYELDSMQEMQLRTAYKEATKQETLDLPFN